MTPIDDPEIAAAMADVDESTSGVAAVETDGGLFLFDPATPDAWIYAEAPCETELASE